MTFKIQQNCPDATIESIINALKEDECIRTMRTAPDAAAEAFAGEGSGMRRNPRGGSCGGRGRGRGGAGTWCSLCNTRTHSLEACWSKDRAPGDSSAPSETATVDKDTLCWHCGESGHLQTGCSVKRRGDKARAGGWKRHKVEEAQTQIAERKSGPGF